MKTLNYIITALALGICSASAITITVHEDSLQAFDFTMDWHQGGANSNRGTFYEGTHNQVSIDWEVYSGAPPSTGPEGYWAYVQSDLYVTSDFLPEHDQWGGTPGRARVELVYDPYPNQIQSLKTSWSDNLFSVLIGGDRQSARWTWKAPHSVPDTGSTLAMLGMGTAVLGFARRLRH